MTNPSTRVDIDHNSLWQVALDKASSALVIYEIVKQGSQTPPQFLIRIANQRAEQLFGMSRKEMIGRFAHDLFADVTSTAIWDDLERVIESNESLRRELFFSQKRTNTADWFEILIEPAGDGRCAVVSFNNISEWKQAQQNLLSDSILFKALSSTVPEMGVVAIDFFRKIVLANGRVPGLFVSESADDLVGRRFLDTVVPKHMDDWQRYISTAFDGEQHYFTDHWGGWRCEVYVGPVRNANGQIVMVLTVFKNVSEQHKQQQALQQANVSLHRSNENLERFAYVASHDLQEPLRKIRSFGDLLDSRYADALGDGGRDLLARMQSAATRMDELIRSLLTFSRINTPNIVTADVDLAKLLKGVESDLEMIIEEKKARVEIRFPMPIVPGDETQLRQLFQNLLTNALKFVQPGVAPRVVISARIIDGNEAPDHPDAGCDPRTKYVEISVADNGIGIAKENFGKIFGLFTRLHGRSQYAGTGIGLATTKRVAENHGGTIDVQSEEGKGTTFKVYLPVGQAPLA